MKPAAELAAEALTVPELLQSISAEKRWWQTVRVEKFGRGGMNAILELRPGLSFILGLFWIAPRRAILSVLPNRSQPYCVMIDGVDHSRKWCAELPVAVQRLVSLV